MALPQQLKTARMTTADLGNTIPTNFGNMESALCDIFGFTVNSNITASAMSFDNSGRITKALVEQLAAGPVGWRFRNSTNNAEMRVCVSGSTLQFDQNVQPPGTEAVPNWVTRFSIDLTTGALTGSAFSTTNPGLAPAMATADTTKYLNGGGTYTVPAAVAAKSCHLHHSTTQNISNGDFNALNFDTADWDVGSLYSAGSPTRITFPSAGAYAVHGFCGFAANVTGRRVLDVRYNGGSFAGRGETAPNSSVASQTFVNTFAIINAVGGDYVELTAWQSSGGVLSTVTGPQFAAYKIGG